MRKPAYVSCPWGCGKQTTPGPMKVHAKSCELNPDAGYTIDQPRATCEFCGYETTKGALTVHMRYGCPNRPSDGGDARQTCRFCGEVTTLPGPLISHERVCAKNPEADRADLVEVGSVGKPPWSDR